MRKGGTIRLYCWECGVEVDCERASDPTIPDRVCTIESRCPECVGGDFSEEVWLDVTGREVPQTEEARMASIEAEMAC